MCPVTGLSYNEPAPHTFSFNSPQGACPHCNGLGEISSIDEKKLIPDGNLASEKEELNLWENTGIYGSSGRLKQLLKKTDSLLILQ